MRLRLIRKLAERLDGVDVSSYREGDALELPRREAELLLAEGWALALAFGRQPDRKDRGQSAGVRPAQAADTPRGTNRRRLQEVQRAVDLGRFEPHAYRRIEDRLRDELHDAHARIITPPVRTYRQKS